jgi:hypothetical protein
VLLAFLLVRRPRRLRHLRRLATAQAGPGTRILLPGPTAVASRQNRLPLQAAAVCRAVPPIDPVAAHDQEQRDEMEVRAWLHLDQYGRTDTALPAPASSQRLTAPGRIRAWGVRAV